MIPRDSPYPPVDKAKAVRGGGHSGEGVNQTKVTREHADLSAIDFKIQSLEAELTSLEDNYAAMSQQAASEAKKFAIKKQIATTRANLIRLRRERENSK